MSTRHIRIDLARVAPESWSRTILEAASIPPPVTFTIIVPTNAVVPMALDELRLAHGPRVGVVGDDWLTVDRWRAALREGVAAWLGISR